jgi:hypothetical protein
MAGTRRTPIARPHAASLASVLLLYQAAVKARKRWQRYRTDDHYAAFVEARKNVDRALFGPSRLWKTSIWDVVDIHRRKPPEEPRQRESYEQAVALLKALEALDREQQQQERAAQRAEPEREREIGQPEPTPPPSS